MSDFGGGRKYPYGGNFVWMFSVRHTTGIFAIIRPFHESGARRSLTSAGGSQLPPSARSQWQGHAFRVTALAAEGKTQQRIGASEKTTTFTDEAKIRCCVACRPRGATSLFCFVQARSGASRKQGFEGAPLSFLPRRSGGIQQN